MALSSSAAKRAAQACHLIFSIPSLVIVAALIMLLAGDMRPPSFKQVDRYFWRLSQAISPPREVKSPLAIIRIDEQELTLLKNNPMAASSLSLLTAPNQIAMTLPQPFMEQALVNPQESEKPVQWPAQSHELTRLRKALEGGDILVGLTRSGASSFPEQAYPVVIPQVLGHGWKNRLPTGLYDGVSQWFKQRLNLVASPWPVDSALKGAGYRATSVAEPGQPLPMVWDQESQIHSGLALAMYTRYLASTIAVVEEPQISFMRGYGVELAHRWLPLSNSGQIVPDQIDISGITRMTLQQALISPPSEPIWLFVHSEKYGESVARVFLSLVSGEYSYTPYWKSWVMSAAVLLLGLYLIFIQPSLRPPAATFMVIFILVAMALIQLSWQLSFKQILPLVLPMQWFLISSLVMMLWQRNQYQKHQCRQEQHQSCLQLAQIHIQQGDFSHALTAAEGCQAGDDQLDLFYRIAVQLERKGNYQDAIEVYRRIHQQQPDFKEAKKRIDGLSQWIQPVGFPHGYSQEMVRPVQLHVVTSAEVDDGPSGGFALHRKHVINGN